MMAEVESTLVIENLSRLNKGMYRCLGTNSIGRAIIDFKVAATEPAKIIQTDNDETDNQISVSCQASGSPAPVIRWIEGSTVWSSTESINTTKEFSSKSELFMDENGKLSDLKELQTLSHRYFSKVRMRSDENLQLDLIFNKHANAPKFMTCDAQNAHGREQKKVKTKVDNGIRYSDEKGAEVSLSVDFHQTRNLDCNIEGSPKPSFEWTSVS